ncbi:MAG: polysaccharide biosynthesis protein [Prevotella sp.]|nr:polysaccharide biosynthesis protein [Prevotella sp.]
MNTLNKILNWYFSKDSLPYWCLLLVDTVIVFLSALFTYWVFNKTFNMFQSRLEVLFSACFYAVLSWIGAKAFSTYSGIIRYSSFVDLLHVAYANGTTWMVAIAASLLMEHLGIAELTGLTQTEITITFIIATLLMWFIRIVVKALHDVSFSNEYSMRVLIYGAFTGGIGLAKNIRSQKPKRFSLCGFISHDKRAKHMQLMGKNVYHIDDDLASVIEKRRIQAVLVSPYKVDDFRNNSDLQDTLIKAGVRIFFAQQVKEASVEEGEIADNDVNSMQVEEVSVEDLLPRSEIKIDMASVGEMLTGKNIMITGSAGSIGSEMVRQIAVYKPARMILLDQAETPQHDISLMMASKFPDIKAEIIVTSICHEHRMERIFQTSNPDYVFHAAAYKHVPMMEDNPTEAVLNNVHGTKVLADLSVKYGVKKFVMISTDKAVNPTNVMGCSKRICEIYVQSLNNVQDTTQFVTTRFGNVLGSNGSVIPLFREQIKHGGPVTVTDEHIVRYFMLIPEACKLVLEAGTKGHGGEIFVFDMGQPVKIIDLAKRMIFLSGAKNVEIKVTGLRPGEKLYEEVLNKQEGYKPSFHDKILIAETRQYGYKKANRDIKALITIAKKFDNMAIVKKMKEIVPEYKSNNSVYEQLD